MIAPDDLLHDRNQRIQQ